MKSPSRSARTAFAISVSPPHRPSGVARSTALNSSSLVSGGARIGPGAMALTRMLSDARFRDVVRHKASVPGTPAFRQPVAEIDDAAAALLPHVRCGRVRAEKSGAEVDVQYCVPLRRIELGERPFYIHRRHVDQNVEPAEGFDDPLDERLAGLRLREIGLDGRGATVDGPHALGRALRLGARS